MASAAPQKRMVSSVFITLASPCRGTVTQQQHARKTHNAPARDVMQHTAVRVNPGGDGEAMSLLRHRKESAAESHHGGTAQGSGVPRTPMANPQARPPVTPPATARPPVTLPPTARPQVIPPGAASLPDPVFGPVFDPSLEDTEQHQTTQDKSPEECFPTPPPPPMSLGTELPGKAAPPLPGPPSEQTLLSGSPAPAPYSNKQDTIVETERITPCSGSDSNGASLCLQSSPVHTNVESKEVCGFCRKPVALSEPAIQALNRTYHDSCFQCRQCHLPLAGKLYYNKAGIPLCEDCYQASLELCWACGEVIKDHVIRALERTYHPPCFICATCSQPIGEQRFAQGEVGEVYCLQDYYRKYAPQCSACQQLIIPREDGTDSYTVECLGRSFHEDCYRCEVCITQLSPEPNDQGCHPLDGRVLCKSCHLTLVQSAQL